MAARRPLGTVRGAVRGRHGRGQNGQPAGQSQQCRSQVRQAIRATSRHKPIAGPLLRNLPKSAKNIIDKPKIVVMALAVMLRPRGLMLRPGLAAGVQPGAISSR